MKIKPKQKNRNLASNKAPPPNQIIHYHINETTPRKYLAIRSPNQQQTQPPTNQLLLQSKTHMNRSNHQSPPLSPISPSNHCVIHTNVKPIQRSTPTDHRTNHHFTTIDLRERFRDFSKSTI